MAETTGKPLDTRLRGISTEGVTPGKLIKGIRGAGDAARKDAFRESPLPLDERRDARK